MVRGYKNSRGFKMLLPFPFLGQFPAYEDTEAEDLRSHFRQLMREQGARSAGGGWVCDDMSQCPNVHKSPKV